MINCFPAIDVPMFIRARMRLCPDGNQVQQLTKSTLRPDPAEIGAVRAQLSKHRLIVRRHSLTNDGDPEPRNPRRFGRYCSPQAVSVVSRGLAKCVQLMRAPKVSGKALDELSRRLRPIKLFELRRELDLCESLKPRYHAGPRTAS